MSALDWEQLLADTRGYLATVGDLDEDDPVPVDELVAQAEANGYNEREVRDAVRDTDALEAVGGLDDLRVHLADDTHPVSSENDATDTDVSGESGGYEGEEPGSSGSNPTPEAEETGPQNGDPATVDSWGGVDFSETAADTYPPELLDVEQWMGRLAGEKMPFSPWAERDHPEADPDKDARYKWGLSENYADGETAGMAEDDPRLDGRLFIQREDDPYAFVDGDDVRDPETGEIHPAFRAVLDHLGVTYADVSSSGAGVHAYYRGELPVGGKGQAAFDIDTEPWGANDDVPAIEIYANKHVNITTGDHLVGTGTEVAEWDDDALRAILEANGYEDKPEVDHDTDSKREDLEGYTPGATGKDETTDEIRDVLKAVDRLEPRDVRLKTSK
nr:hypothetical protein [Haloarcula sp. R1-2]